MEPTTFLLAQEIRRIQVEALDSVTPVVLLLATPSKLRQVVVALAALVMAPIVHTHGRIVLPQVVMAVRGKTILLFLGLATAMTVGSPEAEVALEAEFTVDYGVGVMAALQEKVVVVTVAHPAVERIRVKLLMPQITLAEAVVEVRRGIGMAPLEMAGLVLL